MALEAGSRALLCIHGEYCNCFIVASDGSGAYFFIEKRRTFIFLNFKSVEQTNLTPNYNWLIRSIVAFDKFECDFPETTIFVGIVFDNQTQKFFCTLFSASLRNKTVSVIEQLKINLVSFSWSIPYIYKDQRGEYFVIKYEAYNKLVSVNQITLTKSKKLGFKEIMRHENFLFESHFFLPFVENECLFCFSGKTHDKLIKLPFDGTNSSIISLSNSSNESIGSLYWYIKPIYYSGSIFYSDVSFDKTRIWSLNLQQFCWSIRATVHRHSSDLLNNLQILPDGLAFLHIYNCTQCKSRSHLHEFDLSIVKDYEISDMVLGEGGFGIVVEGKLGDGRNVAVKILHDFSALPAISEARKLKSLNHVNIVKGYGYTTDETKFLLFMELMKESVRQKILRSPKTRLEDKEALRILQQALEGLVYLHTFKPKPIVHRDIKCANILLDESGVVKLGDLGLVQAVIVNTAGTTNLAHALNETAGTNYWQAPEVLEAEALYGRKADVWSIGCSLVEMLTGYPPYYKLQPTQWAIGLFNGKLTYSPNELIPDVSTDVKNILEKCFTRQAKASDAENNGRIRPHSWEILTDVLIINELRPMQEEIQNAEKRAEKEITQTKQKEEEEIKQTMKRAEEEITQTKQKEEEEIKQTKKRAEEEITQMKQKEEEEIKRTKKRAEEEIRQTIKRAEEEIKQTKKRAEEEIKQTINKKQETIKQAEKKVEGIQLKIAKFRGIEPIDDLNLNH